MRHDLPAGGRVAVRDLGQMGFRLQFGELVVYIDPYLSDSVRVHEAADLRRLRPIPLAPAAITDADYVLVTHDHRDHCDRDTLLPLLAASPHCRLVGPMQVCRQVCTWGLAEARTLVARQAPLTLGSACLQVTPVPAAHPQVVADGEGGWAQVGYVFDWQERRLYHAGDTGVTDILLEYLHRVKPLHVAFLPVNEQNYFRARRGILGNMSVREAFQLAEELGVETLVPTHWDMFAPNEVYREEIELLYRMLQPNFQLVLEPHLL